MTRPAPGLVEVIVQLAHGLHPEIFAAKAENRKVKMEIGGRFYDAGPRLVAHASADAAKILSICAALAAVLFVEVVVSLQIGAYHMSARDIVVTLYKARWDIGTRCPGNSKA